MDIRELRYIVETAKTCNITKAASNLCISQPALSKSIKKIESELDMTLFFREGNCVIPTEAGKLILKWGETITEDFSALRTELSDLKSMRKGTVVLGVPPVISAFDFPNIILRFRHAFPGIVLRIREAGARKLEESVLDGTIDVAISMRPVVAEGLSEIPLIADQIVCVVTENHTFAQKHAVTIQDLSTASFNTFPEDYAVYQQMLYKCEEQGIVPSIDITSISVDFLLQISNLVPQLEWCTYTYERTYIVKRYTGYQKQKTPDRAPPPGRNSISGTR